VAAAAPALHGVHQADQGRKCDAAAATARQRPCRLQRSISRSIKSTELQCHWRSADRN
jgi:hypothetical protein